MLIGSIRASLPARPQAIGRDPQIGLVDLEARLLRYAVGLDAGHDVDLRAAEPGRILERAVEPGAELGLAPGQAGEAALARGEIARPAC